MLMVDDGFMFGINVVVGVCIYFELWIYCVIGLWDYLVLIVIVVDFEGLVVVFSS